MVNIFTKIAASVAPTVHQAFNIKLFTPIDHVYQPGDTVQGSVTLVASSEKELGLEISLYGLAFVKWTEDTGKSRTTYRDHEYLFNVCTCPTVSSEQTQYPFTLQIPDVSMLPWTATLPHGFVQYGVDAIIKAPGILKPRDNKVNIQFLLRSIVHPNLVPLSKNPGYFDNTKTEQVSKLKTDWCCFPVCCWYYCGNENVKLSMKTSTLWAYPGSEIEYTLTVDNTQTERYVKNAKVQLVGCWTRRAKTDCLCLKGKVEREEKFVCVETIHPMMVAPGECITSQGTLSLPLNLGPTQNECNLLKFTYKLKAHLEELSGLRCCIVGDDSVQVDVVVGSDPYGSTLTVATQL